MTTPEQTLVARESDGRWVKGGVSPNPGGRAKGFAAYIRDATSEGQELVDFVLGVLRGEEIEGEKPGLKVRMHAAVWLADRGFGRPVQSMEISHVDRLVLDGATYDDLKEMWAQLEAQRKALLLEQEALDGPLKIIEGESRPVGELESAAQVIREAQANVIEGEVIDGDGRVLDSDPAADDG